MAIAFDPARNAMNLRKHGVSLLSTSRFDWDSAQITIDDREDYGEVRMRAIGFIDTQLYVLVFTDREDVVRPISLRKAKPNEREAYDRTVG